MKLWVVLEANNCDTDIWVSEPFVSKEFALEHLKRRYHENIDDIDEGNLEYHYCADGAYAMLTYGNDYYYGVVRDIDIKEMEE